MTAAPGALVGYLPSPSVDSIHVGAFQLRFYGLMIALGVWAAVALARRRWMDRGGERPDIGTIALWAVPAGLVGARLYSVATDWQHTYSHHPIDALKIWNGGLGIPGGIAAGAAAGIWVVRKHGWPLPTMMDVVAPALPLAQAIGRLGNWFNQELYGRPSDLPWALTIDRAHRQPGYLDVAHYQPTFLYEALWNVALVVLLVRLDKKRVLAAGNLFWLYIAGYGVGRFWVEALRSDPAYTHVLGLRINSWTSGLAVVVGLSVAVVRQRRHQPDPMIVVGPDAEPSESAGTLDRFGRPVRPADGSGDAEPVDPRPGEPTDDAADDRDDADVGSGPSGGPAAS